MPESKEIEILTIARVVSLLPSHPAPGQTLDWHTLTSAEKRDLAKARVHLTSHDRAITHGKSCSSSR